MKKQTIVLGVSSSIAAYKLIELVKFLRQKGLEVFVVMTKNASKMISVKDFEKASGNKVYIDLFEKKFNYKNILNVRHIEHIDLADKANVIVISPATANIIAKIAYGLADDFLTTMLLATNAPVIICPAMNIKMWQNPLVQENISKLKKLGYIIVEPEEGMLACGYEGKGRLANIKTINNQILEQLQYNKSLQGKKILVTAGATIEKIDDVRFITNKSSGKMGAAIAQECFLRGADVFLLRAKKAVKPCYLIPEKTFETFDELFSLIKMSIGSYDVVFHTAAVSDFYPESKHKGKMESKSEQSLLLKPREKIINQIKKLNPKIKLIAFKAQWGISKKDLVQIADKKIKESSCDAVIINDVSKKDRGFGVDKNEVFIVLAKGLIKKISLSFKKDVASDITDYLISEKYL
ncbi:MAG: bifunctional phosphopantothenoylcysteine decarboxylase/phosphopantothenate--cysteine ligase CoaBC [Candidatus Levybacteria bacterium]|nr:bifunctional phosphopantothenoylcysteine decarboxylase/phosphopantothenate--cysteine ligase CoaBC [Candidatus Levybacteria bacterium]